MAEDEGANSAPPSSSPAAEEVTREVSPARVEDALTFRAVTCAIVLGSLVCFANIYLGLQAGTVNAMPMQTALLGYALFRGLRRYLPKPLSPAETTVIEVVAGAIGLAPFSSGYTGLIPGMEFLTSPSENGPMKFSVAQLLLWCFAIFFIGVVVAAPFRRLFILRYRLRFPSATATGTMIGLLFGKEDIIKRAHQSATQLHGRNDLSIRSGVNTANSADPNSMTGTRQGVLSQNSDDHLVPGSEAHAVNLLLVSFGGSAIFGIVSFFLPILKRLPIFGHVAADQWLWSFDLTPAYFGYGIIIGTSINLHMLCGAILGWGILSPIAKNYGWASGDINSWDNGPRGWLIWVGMGFILGDSAVGLGWSIFQPWLPWMRHLLRSYRANNASSPESNEGAPLLHGIHQDDDSNSGQHVVPDDDWSSASLVSQQMNLWACAIVLVIFLVIFCVAFRSLIVVWAPFIALLLIPPAALISMRSLGETDNGASLAIGASSSFAIFYILENGILRIISGRVAQLIIGLVVPKSNKNRVFANLLLGGAVETSASQASQHMGGLKTAYMTKTPPKAIFYAQVIGSISGICIATLIYRIYTSVMRLPNEELQIPDAHLWLVAARLVYQQGLPPSALSFSLAAFAIGLIFSALRIYGSTRWWRDLVPSGVAMAIGIYIVPGITLARVAGSLIYLACRTHYGVKHFDLLCAATGLILGQGISSIITLIFDAAHVQTASN